MTWEELLKSVSSGRLPRVRRGASVGYVTTIKNNGRLKGCGVDFGQGYDVWFHADDHPDRRSKYMSELDLLIELNSNNDQKVH